MGRTFAGGDDTTGRSYLSGDKESQRS